MNHLFQPTHGFEDECVECCGKLEAHEMKILKCLGCGATCAGKGLPRICPKCHRGSAYLKVIGKV